MKPIRMKFNELTAVAIAKRQAFKKKFKSLIESLKGIAIREKEKLIKPKNEDDD